jgi:hypothetical protein
MMMTEEHREWRREDVEWHRERAEQRRQSWRDHAAAKEVKQVVRDYFAPIRWIWGKLRTVAWRTVRRKRHL